MFEPRILIIYAVTIGRGTRQYTSVRRLEPSLSQGLSDQPVESRSVCTAEVCRPREEPAPNQETKANTAANTIIEGR